MPEVLDWRNATEVRQLVERAAQALIGGQIVAFPTETYYVLAADASQPEAVARLASGQENPAFLLALRGSEELADWVPNSGSLARRLARRCWPGPMTLLVDQHSTRDSPADCPSPCVSNSRRTVALPCECRPTKRFWKPWNCCPPR